jgi:hypothetical protein
LTVTRELRLREIQLPEKYKLNFKVSSEGPFVQEVISEETSNFCLYFSGVVSLSIRRCYVLR